MPVLAGVSPAGALIVRAGEPKVLHVRLLDAAGQPQQVDGRTFELVVRLSVRTGPSLIVPGELSGDGGFVVVGMTADQATMLYELGRSRALSYDIVETTGGATISRWTARLTVEPAPELPGDIVPMWADLPAAQALVKPDAIVISERGAGGPSAARQLFEGGLIDEPTVEAMDERYLEGSTAAGAAAASANSAAAAATAATGAAAVVVAAGATIVAAVPVAEEARDEAVAAAALAGDRLAAAGPNIAYGMPRVGPITLNGEMLQPIVISYPLRVEAGRWLTGPNAGKLYDPSVAVPDVSDLRAFTAQYVSVAPINVGGRLLQPTVLQRGTLRIISGIYLDTNEVYGAVPTAAVVYSADEIVVFPTGSTILNICTKGSKASSAYYIRRVFKLYSNPGGMLSKARNWRHADQWECIRTGEFTFVDVRMLGNDVETDTAFQPAGGYTTDAGLQPAVPGGADPGALLIGGQNHAGEFEYDGTLPAYSGYTPFALADGQPYDLSAPVAWRGRKFEFFHRTAGLLWNYSVAGSTVTKTSLSNTQLFDAYKRHEWSAAGYQLDQTVTWKADAAGAAVALGPVYSGMGLIFRREAADTGTTNPFITNAGYFGPGFAPIALTTTGYAEVYAPTGSTKAKLSGPTGISFEWADLSGGLKAFGSGGVLSIRDTSGRNKLYPNYGLTTPAIGATWAISNRQRLDTAN